MIRAVVWKELREQGVIGVALVVLGGGVIVAAAALGNPPAPSAGPGDLMRALGAARLAALMLVVTVGLVCGGMLFAAEREAGTLTFLDTLPGSRARLWRAKLLAGLVLAAAQVALLLVVCAVAEVTDGAFARRLAVYAVLAYCWGAFGSTLSRTTLGSVGVAIVGASLASFVFLLPVYAFLSRSGVPRQSGWLLFEVLMLVAPLALSARAFTSLDRARAADAGADAGTVARSGEGVPVTRPRGRPGLGLRATAWLTLRQMRLPGLVLSLFALAFGFALLLPGMRVMALWPPLALAAGVLAGVTVFGPEQSHRIGGFWAEQRLPAARAWWVKVGLHLLLVVWLLALLALPAIIRGQVEGSARTGFGSSILGRAFHSRLFGELGVQGWKFLLLPAAYGFAFGHLFGLLFRKPVVAAGAASVVGGATAAVWVPSVFGGGLTHWQAWTPAAAVLLTGRFVIAPWAADRAAERGPLLRVTGGLTVALLVLAVGVGYRAIEVPDHPNGEDDLAFVASLPSYDQNLTGRDFRAAAERFTRAAGAAAPGERGIESRRGRVEERLEGILRTGWPPNDPEFAAAVRVWLEAVFTDPTTPPGERTWAELAEAAGQPDRPPGVYELPQSVTSLSGPATAAENARRMSAALLVRGLQRQADGDPTVFARDFRTVLALARTLRYGGGVVQLLASFDIERAALLAADRWLERVPPPTRWAHVVGGRDTAPLLAVVTATDLADRATMFDPQVHTLADRYVLRELMKAPEQWLTPALTPPGGDREQVAAEMDLVAFAWTVPWEKERTRRLVGMGAEGPLVRRYGLVTGRPGGVLLLNRARSPADLTEADRYLCTIRRALILKCAVRAYQIERGEQPRRLEELVPLYLTELPSDPYADGQPFRYERAEVELQLRRPPPPTVPSGMPPLPGERLPPFETVRAGQGRVWSVGTDGVDQHGEVAPGGLRAEDIVFIVPLPYTTLLYTIAAQLRN